MAEQNTVSEISLPPVDMISSQPNAVVEKTVEEKKDDVEAPKDDGITVVTGEEVMNREQEAIRPKEKATEDLDILPNDPQGVQKRIKKLADQKNEAKNLYAQKEKENQELRSRLEALSRQPQPPVIQTPAPQNNASNSNEKIVDEGVKKAPSQDDFSSYDDYIRAVTKYETEKTLDERVNKAKEERRIREQVEFQHRSMQTFIEKAEVFKSQAPDFEQVAFNPALTVSHLMKEAIMTSEKSAEILYYLGKNPDVAKQIAYSDPITTIKTIGRIEHQFMQTTNGRTSKSKPPPISTLHGSSSAPAVNAADVDDYEEYRALRLAGKIK